MTIIEPWMEGGEMQMQTAPEVWISQQAMWQHMMLLVIFAGVPQAQAVQQHPEMA
jgi:hypothetical protein